jgi:hypothetical protein
MRTFPEGLRQLQSRHRDTQLTDSLWPRFQHRFEGDVDGANRERACWRFLVQSPTSTARRSQGSEIPVLRLATGGNLSDQPISLLAAEASRLEALIGVDSRPPVHWTALNSKIAADEGRARSTTVRSKPPRRQPARLGRDKGRAPGRLWESFRGADRGAG